MKRLSFVEGLAIAVAASVSGGLLFSALAPWFPLAILAKLIVSLIAFGYVAYLLIRAPRGSGCLSVFAIWALIAVAGWLFIYSLPAFIVLHLTLIWLIRSLYCYHSPVAALIDLVLCGLSLAAAILVTDRTGSLALGIWCLFLIQALAAAIPPDFKRCRAGRTNIRFESDRFERARRSAEWALGKLSSSTD